MIGPGAACLAVVVPAHNEEELLGRCLQALAVARDHARAALPALEVSITIVLDRCTDDSLRIVRGFGVGVHEVELGCVGAARRAGVEVARRGQRIVVPEEMWTLHTDADSVVPADWLVQHHALSAQHDLVLGRVVPDPLEIDPHRGRLWDRLHPVGKASVHGANLGIRLSLYDQVGGFDSVPVHEDRHLVAAALQAGAAWTVGTSVTTSARLRGRTPEGFASYLRDLAL